jgi:hypothetical protein
MSGRDRQITTATSTSTSATTICHTFAYGAKKRGSKSPPATPIVA